MTNEEKARADALTTAKEALEKTDKEKFPKLYATREELVKSLEYAQNQKIRAEKAEKEAKKASEPQEKETPTKPAESEAPKLSDYSLQDVRALQNVHDEDVERVEKFAKSEGVSVAEALKFDDLKAILKNREEQRKTAAAASTGKSKRGESKISGKKIYQRVAEGGELPEKDEDIEAMAEARLKEKLEQSR